MNTQEREQIGRLIRRFAAKAATDDLLVLIAETDGLLEACKRLLSEAKDPVTAAWLQSECESAKTRPNLFLAEIEDILTVIKPSQEHADLFALLELEPGAGREAIKRNYRRLSRRYHPDAGGSEGDEDTFIRITKAYQQLMAYAETAATELPAPRRETSHWRRSLVPDITEARRTQKRRNVVMVALLSLTLIFVSLLAARTYNSRVMMSGLKNKSLALVPPTVGDQPPPATTPSAPTTASTKAQPARKNPTTTAATPSPTPPDKHTAKVGCAPRTNCDPSAQTTASTEAQPTPTNPTTKAAASSPTPTDEHTAKVGCAARTNCDPSATTTASAEAQPPHKNPAPKAAAQSPTPPDKHAAKVGCAARTNCDPSATTTASAEAQSTRKDNPSAPTSAPAKASAPTAEPEKLATIEPTPPADEPAVQLTPGNRKKTAPPPTVAAHHQAAAPSEAPAAVPPAAQEQPTHQPAQAAASATAALAATTPASSTGSQPSAAAAEPATKPTIAPTQPPPAEHTANVGRAVGTESTPPVATTAGTEAQPPATPSSAAPASTIAATQPSTSPGKQVAKPSLTPPSTKTAPSTPILAATQLQSVPTATDHPTPSPESVVAAAAEPQPPKPQPRERIDAFLHAYTAAYEQKNLPTFARFFAADATENGKTLNEVLSAYRELFTTAQTLRFTVSPQDYEHREGQLHLRGRFTIAMTFKDEVTTSGQGDITFRLTDTTPPQVQTLRYTFDQ